MRAAHGGAIEHVSHHQGLRRILVAREPAVLRDGALQIERDAHLHEHVGAVGGLVIDAQARLDAVAPRGLQGA